MGLVQILKFYVTVLFEPIGLEMSIQHYMMWFKFQCDCYNAKVCCQKKSAIHHTVHASIQANFAM